MFKIKTLKTNYTKFGVLLPNEEKTVKELKEVFYKPIGYNEKELFEQLKKDENISIEKIEPKNKEKNTNENIQSIIKQVLEETTEPVKERKKGKK